MDSGELTEKESLLEQFEIRQAMLGGHRHNYNTDRGWKRVHNRTISNKRSVLRRNLNYAAAIMLLVGAGMFLYDRNRDAEPIRQLAGEAELIRANGDRITLTDNGAILVNCDKVLIENDAESGILSYSAGVAESAELKYDQLIVPQGGTYTIELSDGTIVHLNSKTTLRFPAKFAQGSREVYLEGEALFNVARNETAPFYVHVADNRIRVLGTVFNVCAYGDEQAWQTILAEGSVSVNRPARPEILLTPGQRLTVDKTSGNSEVTAVDALFHTSWVEGKYYFNDMALGDIVRKLQRLYDFDMTYADESLKYSCFSGAINKGRPIEELFGHLEQTNNIKFKIRGREIKACHAE